EALGAHGDGYPAAGVVDPVWGWVGGVGTAGSVGSLGVIQAVLRSVGRGRWCVHDTPPRGEPPETSRTRGRAGRSPPGRVALELGASARGGARLGGRVRRRLVRLLAVAAALAERTGRDRGRVQRAVGLLGADDDRAHAGLDVADLRAVDAADPQLRGRVDVN